MLLDGFSRNAFFASLPSYPEVLCPPCHVLFIWLYVGKLTRHLLAQQLPLIVGKLHLLGMLLRRVWEIAQAAQAIGAPETYAHRSAPFAWLCFSVRKCLARLGLTCAAFESRVTPKGSPCSTRSVWAASSRAVRSCS